jgi:hypothetical protein
MKKKDEERLYSAVFAAALVLAAVLALLGLRRLVDRLHSTVEPELPVPTFPVKGPETPPTPPGMTRSEAPPVFIMPMRISQKLEKRKYAPPARPEPPIKPDIRETP